MKNRKEIETNIAEYRRIDKDKENGIEIYVNLDKQEIEKYSGG